MEGEELFNYIEKYQNKDYKYDELYNKWKQAENNYYSLGIVLEEGFGYIKEYLKQYGINAETSVQMESDNNYEAGNIIASVNFDLYKKDNIGKYSERNDVNAHYLYVVGVDKKGRVIVSSWGDRFIFDDDDAYQTSKLVLKLSK